MKKCSALCISLLCPFLTTAMSQHHHTPAAYRATLSSTAPAPFHATYHDPIMGIPMRVRYVPTKQEILEYDIRQLLQHSLLAAPYPTFDNAGRAATCPDLFTHACTPDGAQYAALRLALFTRALKHGTPQQITALLAAKADPNSPDSNGMLPLHTAVQYTNMGAVQLLVAAQADIHAPDQRGDTVLHVAAHKENPALIFALLDAGANPESQSKNGETILVFLEKRKSVYLDMQRDYERKNREYVQENNGQELPTFQAVVQNLQEKLDNLDRCLKIENRY